MLLTMYDEEFQYVYVFIKVSIIDNPFISNDFSLHYAKKDQPDG